MPFVAIGPTELFVDAWCQQDAHVKAWRYNKFKQFNLHVIDHVMYKALSK